MKASTRKRSLVLGLGICAAAGTVVSFRQVDRAPLVWSGLLWCLFAAFGWFAAESPRARGRWLNATALCLAICAVEGFLWVQTSPNLLAFGPEFSFEGNYYEPNTLFDKPDTTLGYRPRPGAKARAIKKYKGEVVYDVEYEIDPHGLRVGAPLGSGRAGCVLFFGDSLAWGEGVQNTETAAYQLGLSMRDYRVYNFAVTGYSAHQLAAQVERDVVSQAIECDPDKPVHVVYQVLPSNVARAAGLGTWDEFGPRYILSRSGKVVRQGYFSRGDYILNDRFFVPRKVLRYVAKTMLYERAFGRLRRTNDFDLQRFVKIVNRGLGALRDRLPHLDVLMLVWYDMDEDGGLGPRTRAMYESFKALQLDVHYISEVIPNYDAELPKYHILHDGHPNAEAHRHIAAYVQRWLAASSAQSLLLGSTTGHAGLQQKP